MFKKKNIPNIITVFRGVLTLVIIVLFLIDAQKYMIAIFTLFVIASLSDFVDGYLARKWHVVSDFGKTADPLLDKILVFSLLVLIFPTEVVPQWAIMILILRDLIIDSLRSYLVSQKITMPAIFTAKVKTTCQMLMIALTLLFLAYPDMAMLAALAKVMTILAVIMALISAYKYFRVFFDSRHKVQ